MPIDCDADAMVRSRLESRMKELRAELKTTAVLYMNIKKDLDEYSVQLNCEQHDWVLGNTGIISRVCVKCGAIL